MRFCMSERRDGFRLRERAHLLFKDSAIVVSQNVFRIALERPIEIVPRTVQISAHEKNIPSIVENFGQSRVELKRRRII